MARTRMVTRTINVTTVKALTVDILTNKVENLDFELTGETYTNEKALKFAKKLYETETLKIVSVVSMEVSEELYGMLETDFIKSAKRLDNETRKFLEENEENDDIETE